MITFLIGERLTLSCWLYLLAATATAFPSLYFFTSIERSSDLSPAQSRLLNRPCVALNFFDYHDLWHFLSCAGMFFTFMFLLNIDEDVKYKPRSRLCVF